MKTTFDHMFYLPVPQLEDILKMGFQNKFYNASKKVSGPGSTQAVEYRVNMSSDTPHWYVRDYMARVSNHYGINSISVDGENRFIGCSSEALGSTLPPASVLTSLHVLFLVQTCRCGRVSEHGGPVCPSSPVY